MILKPKSYPVPPNSVYVWRGFKSATITYDKFAQVLGSVFVPACVLLQPPVGLRAYLPTMVPQAGKPPAVPDQTALMFWATPESHDLAEKAIAVRIYQDLHGDAFDPIRSDSPEVPLRITTATGALKSNQPYFLFDQPADWMLGRVHHLVGARRPDLTVGDFLAAAYTWASQFRNQPPRGVDAGLVCCGDDYAVAWVHSDKNMPSLAKALDELAALTVPVLRADPRSLKIPAGLWDDWPGLDLTKDTSLNMQLVRPPAGRAKPRKRGSK